jgi:hypothetical protein
MVGETRLKQKYIPKSLRYVAEHDSFFWGSEENYYSNYEEILYIEDEDPLIVHYLTIIYTSIGYIIMFILLYIDKIVYVTISGKKYEWLWNIWIENKYYNFLIGGSIIIALMIIIVSIIGIIFKISEDHENIIYQILFHILCVIYYIRYINTSNFFKKKKFLNKIFK